MPISKQTLFTAPARARDVDPGTLRVLGDLLHHQKLVDVWRGAHFIYQMGLRFHSSGGRPSGTQRSAPASPSRQLLLLRARSPCPWSLFRSPRLRRPYRQRLSSQAPHLWPAPRHRSPLPTRIP
ncbi:hypothetical protein FA95DRAFT_932435 [Auriscalpium vulgare]|uniref:Uncharacterized protein n=1 Tax=Auriscalpium vulgare TaxID=40419 RepID=A0ACB8SAC3_9AGAM|nr:hypothetical protein FA95DRAFT_932435 [Auriscalpium vulgare]